MDISSDDDSDNEECILVPRNLSASAIKVRRDSTLEDAHFCARLEIRKTVDSKVLSRWSQGSHSVSQRDRLCLVRSISSECRVRSLHVHSYPSGNLAIVISEVARAMHLYTAFDDEPAANSKQIAQFDPFGNGYCNFINGDLRYDEMYPSVCPSTQPTPTHMLQSLVCQATLNAFTIETKGLRVSIETTLWSRECLDGFVRYSLVLLPTDSN